MSESLDAADLSVQEAAAIDGATRWQTFAYVLLPMHVNAFLSYYLYSLESNFRDSVVLGIVGAGGIGVDLIAAVGLFKYRRVGVVVLTIILTALAVDLASRAIRGKLLR
jgi:phosphonate transport system permease protein